LSLTTAQAFDYLAGNLNTHGASGGPGALAHPLDSFYVGINDPLGGNPLGSVPFTPFIFGLYDEWAKSQHSRASSGRASIARGEVVFNTKPINIVNVAGLNDDLDLPSIPGNCGTCHDTPNVGNHSLPVPLNIGVGDLDSPLDVSYLPVFTLQNKLTGEIKKTTDPGRALLTGVWKDVGRIKGPILRGLAARPPYFHNGSARSLGDVIDFYNQRFNVGITAEEKADLVAFLNTL
jgi:cytochrome c peroxidase